MIKMICDECGKDCDLCAYDVYLGSLHNPRPVRLSDIGEAQITCENTHIRFVLCQDCYAKHNLPNLWLSVEEKRLAWSEEDEKL